MEELDLKELFNIFWNKKIQIIIIVLIFSLIGIVYTLGFTTPMYSSSTTFLLASANKNESTDTTITSTDVTLNSKLVSTYSELVKSKKVLRKVKANLDMDINEESLKRNVKVSSVKNTEVIEITVTTQSAINSARIANEIVQVFAEEVVKGFYGIENVQVVDEAEPKDTPSNINHQKDIILFAFIGFVISVAYVLVLNMFDTTVKTAEEVEKEFKLPVLAAIPTYGNEAQKQKRKGGRK